jgi:hypothetical protein
MTSQSKSQKARPKPKGPSPKVPATEVAATNGTKCPFGHSNRPGPPNPPAVGVAEGRLPAFRCRGFNRRGQPYSPPLKTRRLKSRQRTARSAPSGTRTGPDHRTYPPLESPKGDFPPLVAAVSTAGADPPAQSRVPATEVAATNGTKCPFGHSDRPGHRTRPPLESPKGDFPPFVAAVSTAGATVRQGHPPNPPPPTRSAPSTSPWHRPGPRRSRSGCRGTCRRPS